jgi:hypothetical protein
MSNENAVKDINVDLVGKVDYDGFFTVYEDKQGNTWLKLDTEINSDKCHLSAKDNVVVSATGQSGKQIGITKVGDPMMYTGNILIYTDKSTVKDYGLSRKVAQESAKRDVKSFGFTAK